MKRALVVLALIATTQGAFAQGFFQPIAAPVPQRNQQIMTELITIASSAPKIEKENGHEWDGAITSIRGGKGAKRPLGQYLVEPDMEFRSEYKDQPVETMCQFAYDLHEFIVAKGGDYRSMALNQNSTYVSYEKQKEFAIGWWRKTYPKYKDMGGIFKDWFIHDALVDGTNLYNWSRRNKDGGADYIAWADGAVSALLKRK